jgi:hypothetical protein
MTNPTPANVALRSFAMCLAACVLVAALFFLSGHADKAKDPRRIGIMIFVLIAVPIANYFAEKWRQPAIEDGRPKKAK